MCRALWASDYEDSTKSTTSTSRSPLTFFALTFILAIPFWVLGEVVQVQLLPGLPVAALMFVCPGLAALIIVHRESGSDSAQAFLKGGFDCQRIKGTSWYIVILLLNPVISVLSFIVLRLIGTPVPNAMISILPTIALCMVFFLSALGEELGWTGYAIAPLQSRFGPLTASLLLGAVCSSFHFVALWQAHRSMDWIGWWTLGTVSARVIMVYLYNHAGKSVFGAALFHATFNVCWQSFPIHGSYFDPRIEGLISTIVAAVAVLAWRSRPLH